jgi:hypothetical protein
VSSVRFSFYSPKFLMASSAAEDHQKKHPTTADANSDGGTDGSDIFHDAPDSSAPAATQRTASDEEEGNQNEEPEGETLDDESGDDSDSCLVDEEEASRLEAERQRRLKRLAQDHPHDGLDQHNIRISWLTDVLRKIDDVPDEKNDCYMGKLLRLGVDQALILQQVEDMAMYEARRRTQAESEKVVSPQTLQQPPSNESRGGAICHFDLLYHRQTQIPKEFKFHIQKQRLLMQRIRHASRVLLRRSATLFHLLVSVEFISLLRIMLTFLGPGGACFSEQRLSLTRVFSTSRL